MENPVRQHTAFRSSSPAHDHSLKSKQLEMPLNMARARRDIRGVDSNKMAIVKEFGYSEAIIHEAIGILCNAPSNSCVSEAILSIIHQIEDVMETSENTTTVSGARQTGEKQGHLHTIGQERTNRHVKTMCMTSNAACSNYQQCQAQDTHDTTQKNKAEGNAVGGATVEESITVLTKQVGDGSRLTQRTNQGRRNSAEKNNTDDGHSDPEVSRRSTSSSEDSAIAPVDFNHSNALLDDDIYKGGITAPKTKRKKKKKGSKHKVNTDIKHSNTVELEETDGNKKQTQSEEKSGALTSDLKEEKSDTRWVDVRQKQPQNAQVSVIKNSKTKEDVTKLVEENKKLSAAKFCRLCKVNAANLLLLPCRHLVCCVTCGDASENCPLCDAQVIATVKTFMA